MAVVVDAEEGEEGGMDDDIEIVEDCEDNAEAEVYGRDETPVTETADKEAPEPVGEL